MRNMLLCRRECLASDQEKYIQTARCDGSAAAGDGGCALKVAGSCIRVHLNEAEAFPPS